MTNPKIEKLSRVERRQAETKKKVIKVAMRLINEQGFDATTMEQIAEESDIAKGTLYNYFPAKEAIISGYIYETLKGQHQERLELLSELPDTRARMRYMFHELIAGIKRQKDIFERYLVYQMQQIISLREPEDLEKSGVYQLGGEIIRLGQQQGEIRDDVLVVALQDLFEFSLIEVAKQFYMDPDNFDADRVIEQCIDLFLNGTGRRA